MVFTEHLIWTRMQFAASSVLLAGFTTCVVVFPFGHDCSFRALFFTAHFFDEVILRAIWVSFGAQVFVVGLRFLVGFERSIRFAALFVCDEPFTGLIESVHLVCLLFRHD